MGCIHGKQKENIHVVQTKSQKEVNVNILLNAPEKEENVNILLTTPKKGETIHVSTFKRKDENSQNIPNTSEKRSKNLGNTCYFNSAIQALYFTKSFKESLECLQSSSGAQDLEISKTVFDLFRKAELDEDTSKELKHVFNAIRKINHLFMIGTQEDSHELLNVLLGGIFDEIQTFIKDMPHQRQDPDWIDARNIFTGCFIIIYVYDSCKDVDVDFQKFISLSIPTGKSKAKNHRVPRNELETISLELPQEGLEEGFIDLEKVEEDDESCLPCRICNTVGSGRTFRRLLVFQPPPVLVLHIDRFKRDYYHRLTKNTELVQYPKCLNMAKFCSTVAKERLENRSIYHLYAVIVHTGTIYGGHYFAYVNTRRQHDVEKWQKLVKSTIEDEDALKEEVNCFFKRNDIKQEIITKRANCSPNLDVSNHLKSKREDVDANWFYVSDENVKKVPEKDVLSHKDAYILFYEVR